MENGVKERRRAKIERNRNGEMDGWEAHGWKMELMKDDGLGLKEILSTTQRLCCSTRVLQTDDYPQLIALHATIISITISRFERDSFVFASRENVTRSKAITRCRSHFSD